MSAIAFVIVLALLVAAPLDARTSATLQGRVFDASEAVIPRAGITVRSAAAGFDRNVHADAEGRYIVAGIPAGVYSVVVDATGFRPLVIEELRIEVGRTLVRNFHLLVGNRNETVVVRAEIPIVDRATASVGNVVTAQTVQEIPLNGRRFTDLGLLVPGSVAPSQSGFSTTPIRGVGALAINTAGNREEAVGFLVDQSVFVAVNRFGTLGRNVVIGPAFHNTDLSVIKNVTVGGTARLQFRADIFDLFNHGENLGKRPWCRPRGSR